MLNHEGDSPVQLVAATACRGKRWVIAPSRRTIYYLASLAPLEQATAITEAVTALARHHHGPALRLVPPPADEAAS